MAMDPKKLKSYMALEQEEAHEDEEHEAAESPEFEAAEHAGEEEEHDEDELEKGDEEAYEDFVGDLFTHAAALDEAAGAIDMALSHDSMPDADTVEQMAAQLEEMPESVRKGIGEHLVGIPFAEVAELAESLAEEDRISDAAQVAGWLYWAAKTMAA